jgi:hypothetical protein
MRLARVNLGMSLRRGALHGGFSGHFSVGSDLRETDALIGEFLGPGPEPLKDGQPI